MSDPMTPPDTMGGDPALDTATLSVSGKKDKDAIAADGWGVYDPPAPGLLRFDRPDGQGGTQGSAWAATPEAALAAFLALTGS